MKRQRLLSILTLAASLSTSLAHAQKITNPFSSGKKATSFGAMASVPVGQFAGTDLKEGGYAQTGWGLYFDSKTTLKSGLSFISHSTYSWVPLNHKSPHEYLHYRTRQENGDQWRQAHALFKHAWPRL